VVITRVTPSMLPPTIITGADLGSSAAESGKDDRHEREAHVPEQRRRSAELRFTERAELLPVFVPRVGNELLCERARASA
jgi:hypothetical protein